jgi:hypothetical protein
VAMHAHPRRAAARTPPASSGDPPPGPPQLSPRSELGATSGRFREGFGSSRRVRRAAHPSARSSSLSSRRDPRKRPSAFSRPSTPSPHVPYGY